jgi:cell division septation protein DedD
MSDRLPRTEYDVNYLQIIVFIIVFISLLLISFFAGYYAGKKSSGQEKEILQTKKKGEIKKIAQRKPNNSEKSDTSSFQPQKRIEQKTEKKRESLEITPVKQKIKKKPIKKVINKKGISKRSYRKGYYIQIAAFKDLNSAKKKAKRYRRKFKIIIYYPKPEDTTKWYRLWIGPYSNKTSLNKTLKRLKKEFGKKGFIRKID